MKVSAKSATYEVEVEPGECLRIPEEIERLFEAGTWIISVKAKESDAEQVVRDYSALLAAYGPEDEGLYDDVWSGRALDRRHAVRSRYRFNEVQVQNDGRFSSSGMT